MSFSLLAACAINVGFQMVGVSGAGRPDTFNAFERWINLGMFAGMDYLSRSYKLRENPNSILDGVKSIIILGVSFDRVLSSQPNPIKKIKGIVDYARGVDYHFWIKERFDPVLLLHRQLYPHERCRGVVDTAPLLERQFAVNAGLGQIGKNTMLITQEYGSNVFLAAILSTALLHPAKPIFETETKNRVNSKIKIDDDTDNFYNENYQSKNNPIQNNASQNMPDQNDLRQNILCGDCCKCLEVCPTGALVAPYILDARLCLNYWTIEYCGEMPESIRCKLDGRFFGCDTCRQVCPHNAKIKQPRPEPDIDPYLLTKEELRKIAKGTPLERKFK
jgi:epoxyqueuosine reductase